MGNCYSRHAKNMIIYNVVKISHKFFMICMEKIMLATKQVLKQVYFSEIK